MVQPRTCCSVRASWQPPRTPSASPTRYPGVLQASSEQPAPQSSPPSSALALPSPVGVGNKAVSVLTAGSELLSKELVRGNVAALCCAVAAQGQRAAKK